MAVLYELMGDARGDEVDGALFEAIFPALHRFGGAIRPAGIDADDLVQEALARTLALRSLSSIENPVGYLRTAMVRIASNWARSARRSDARVRKAATDQELVDVYPSDLDDLLRASASARAVLFLTVVELQTYREAADVVGCSEPAARQMASRALRSLRADVGAELRPGDAS